MLKIRLFDGQPTLTQQLLVLLWWALLASIIALWVPDGVRLMQSSHAGKFLCVGQLLGLLATYFSLTQFMLMGRIVWVERAFGLDRLASYHRFNGYMAITLILLHPIFITLWQASRGKESIVAAYLSALTEHSYVIPALIAEILFVAVVVSSMYIARKHLKFETWYFVHLMTYQAIVLASLHQFTNGGTLLSSDFARYYWLGLYCFVAISLAVWRFGLPLHDFFKYGFFISRVEPETPTVTSVYIKARTARRLRVAPGQFIMVRILTKKLWWQEHPFTVSCIPQGDELRISVRNVGDYTAEIQKLVPGAKVAVSGPFGRFTDEVAVTDKRLFIAGGIGITPLRALAELAKDTDIDSVLLYANKQSSDVPLKKEIDALGIRTEYVYSEGLVNGAERGLIDIDMIEHLVPDFKQRDIYMCGPIPMMTALLRALKDCGVPPEQIHYESFALHNS